MRLVLLLLGLAAGVSFAVQSAVNARLRDILGSPSWAAFISYLGGTIVMGTVLLVTSASWPTSGALSTNSWLSWTGGFFGAIYVVILILLLPRLGAATALALFIAGQMLASLAIDSFGLFGLPRHPAGLARVIGAVLLIGSVVIIRLQDR
ncbi:MAG: DMT family transporter [Acidisphaera sp.]|nr:DMT family transporter [Acidisphaera sp.]